MGGSLKLHCDRNSGGKSPWNRTLANIPGEGENYITIKHICKGPPGRGRETLIQKKEGIVMFLHLSQRKDNIAFRPP